MNLRGLPAHKEVRIPKWRMPKLPAGFERTDLGDPKGAISQYRGPNNVHVREYPTEWCVHWDYGDPRTPVGLLVHAFTDAPEVGFSLLTALAAGNKTFEDTGSLGEALADAVATGVYTYAGIWLTKELLSWLFQHLSQQ